MWNARAWISLAGVAAASAFGASSPSSSATQDVGKQIWVWHYSPKKDEGASDIHGLTTDRAGNIYLTGFVYTKNNDLDFLTVKLSPTGKMLWRRRYNGTGNDMDRAHAIAVDRAGNVYVTGESANTTGNHKTRLDYCDIVTIKYSPDGKTLWTQRYNGPYDGEDLPKRIALDKAGNVYVFGFSYGSGGVRDGWKREVYPQRNLVTLKYGPDGTRKWVDLYTDGSPFGTLPGDMAVEPNGIVYVTGWTGASANRAPWLRSWISKTHGCDFLTIRYATSGKRDWVRRSAPGWARAIGTDTTGSIYLVGDVRIKGAGTGCTVVKCTASGVEQWSRGPSGKRDWLNLVQQAVVLPTGEVLIAGQGISQTGALVSRVLKRGSNGHNIWSRTLGLANGGFDLAVYSTRPAISTGGYYVVGRATSDGKDTVLTAKLSFDGKERWRRTYTETGGMRWPSAVVAYPDGGAVTACVSMGADAPLGGTGGIVIIRYGP